MARQTGEIFIKGTIDDLTCYKMNGKYYVRMKSSLTRKRFLRDKAFERSRKSAERFALGNKLASKLYRMIDEEKRKYKLYCFLKKKAIALLKENKSVGEAEEVLRDYLKEFGTIEKRRVFLTAKQHAGKVAVVDLTLKRDFETVTSLKKNVFCSYAPFTDHHYQPFV